MLLFKLLLLPHVPHILPNPIELRSHRCFFFSLPLLWHTQGHSKVVKDVANSVQR